eukprot:Awhi_evm1s121
MNNSILLLSEFKYTQEKLNLLWCLKDKKYFKTFFQGIIAEAMRYKPVGPVVLRKCTKRSEIGSAMVQCGTNIVINIAGMNRHKKYFKQPDVVLPERFLSTTTDNAQNINYLQLALDSDLQYLSAPTGHGPKACVGRFFAKAEMDIILGMLLVEFKIDSE